MFWMFVDRFGREIVIGGLLLPFLGMALGIWWHRRYREENDVSSASANAGLGCLAGVVLVPVALMLPVCAIPPGAGIQARDGRARADTIMTALDQYRTRNDRLPDSLSALVPQWLKTSALVGPTFGRNAGYPFAYVRTDSSYMLTFQYVGPGMNHCRITSSERVWHCGRYY